MLTPDEKGLLEDILVREIDRTDSDEVRDLFSKIYNMNSNDSKLNYFLLRKEIKEKFPFNKETDCKDKYNEIIQDYLYDEIISKL